MKKFFLTLMAMLGMATAQAYDYPYLTFETTDGTKTSVSTESIEITLTGTTITAGGQSFDLTTLSKMYFSESDVTAIENVNGNDNGNGIVKVYTQDGAMVGTFANMKSALPGLPKGAYIIKGVSGTTKVMKQ